MLNKNILTDKKGIILITTFLIIVLLASLCIAMISRLIAESKATLRYKESIQAFYLAEAAIDKAIAKLPSDSSDEINVNLGHGQYTSDITIIEAGKKWSVKGYGYIPSQASPRAQRTIEAFLAKKELEDKFWDNAIYTSGEITLNGNSYIVNGDVIYAAGITPDPPSHVTGDSTLDPSIAPLTKLDFADLRVSAGAQIKPDGSDNIYTVLDVALNKPFPTSFWFTRADDGIDNDLDGTADEHDEWVPNVVYVETDLVLNGNIGTIGGFFVVVGNVLTDPDDTAETTINGNGMIDGCIYASGKFRVNGGGGNLNVLGGVWAGSDGARLNGNVTVEYYQPYMDAIRYNLNPSTDMQMISWRIE